MPFIQIIEPEEAEGQLKEIYDDLLQSRGKIAEVHKIQSLNPPTIMAHMDLYMKIMFGRSPLKRYQREMVAVVVSKTNDCNYCIRHHAEALDHFWKDGLKTEKFSSKWKSVELSEIDKSLCEFAENLTLNPGAARESWVEKLKHLGLSDRAILDATLVIGYFNFVNRIVMGLGVQLEDDSGTGYKYD